MKRNTLKRNTLKRNTLKRNIASISTSGLLVCLLCGLSPLRAQGQTPVRRVVPYRSTIYNGQASLYSPTIPYLNYPPTPYANPSLNTLSATAGNSSLAGQPVASAAPPQQTAGTVTAQYTASNELLVQWSGNTNGVRQVTLGLFDANMQLIDRRVITQLPVMAHFAVTGTEHYYGAQVTYMNGKITTVYQPLQ